MIWSLHGGYRYAIEPVAPRICFPPKNADCIVEVRGTGGHTVFSGEITTPLANSSRIAIRLLQRDQFAQSVCQDESQVLPVLITWPDDFALPSKCVIRSH
jgi:hypothetical protein